MAAYSTSNPGGSVAGVSTQALDASIAANRFGLGEPSLAVVGNDPRAWLHAQVGPADAARGAGLPDTTQALSAALARQRALQAARQSAQAAERGVPQVMQGQDKPIGVLVQPAATNATATNATATNATPTRAATGMPPAATDPQVRAFEELNAYFRDTVLLDLRSRLSSAATSQRPLPERLVLFWSNHFTVSLTKGNVRGLVGAFEREAIRPHVASRFEDLLYASVTHPAMIQYLDNQASAGPHSRVATRAASRVVTRQDEGQRPRVYGINENLAREVMELHTLGVNGGYTQADVTAFAAVLTGWRQRPDASLAAGQPAAGAFYGFDPAWHEPGPKTVLGRTYPEGPQALFMVLHDLASHPSTARFISTKLARQFVADDPPPALVDRLTERYMRTRGDLAAVMHELIDSPLAWSPEQHKLKTPEEFAISTARVLRLGDSMFERNDIGGFQSLGQRVHYAPSPAGWPDTAEDWLGPDAVWKRVEWSARQSARLGTTLDARQLAQASLGPQLSPTSREQIARAADGPQALSLLLMSPEFQRR
ncbi:MAG: hypothetical protein JWQ11_3885 [Rhizobacter sp.]|nr:hypothetical protein [Rhizobacter sp.]